MKTVVVIIHGVGQQINLTEHLHHYLVYLIHYVQYMAIMDVGVDKNHLINVGSVIIQLTRALALVMIANSVRPMV